MENMDAMTIVVLATMIISGVIIVVGTIIPSLQEGKAVEKALEAMARPTWCGGADQHHPPSVGPGHCWSPVPSTCC